MKTTSRVALAFVLIALISSQALADGTTVDLGSAWSVWQTWLVTIIGSIVSALAGWVLVLLSNKLGISVDDSMRASLQAAVTNAAGLLLNKLGNQLQGKTIDVKSQAVADVANYVLKNAPDAIAHFGLTAEDIATKIVAKLPQVANTTAAPAP